MTDENANALRKLIDDVNEIEKVAAEMKAARAEKREPSAEVRAILDGWEYDHPTVDDLEEWLDEQEKARDCHDPGDLV
jgi:hypothetical protein